MDPKAVAWTEDHAISMLSSTMVAEAWGHKVKLETSQATKPSAKPSASRFLFVTVFGLKRLIAPSDYSLLLWDLGLGRKYAVMVVKADFVNGY